MKRPGLTRRHLDVGRVLDYLEDRLGGAERREVEDHLAGPCPACRDLLESTARLARSMRDDRVPPVPASLRARAFEVFGVRRLESPVAQPAWRMLEVLFDSLREPLPAGVRRVVGEARWIRFGIAGVVLEIEAEPEADASWTIRGRLDVFDPALFRVDLEIGGESRTTWPDAEGRFVLESLPDGEAELTLSGPEGLYRLPRFAL